MNGEKRTVSVSASVSIKWALILLTTLDFHKLIMVWKVWKALEYRNICENYALQRLLPTSGQSKCRTQFRQYDYSADFSKARRPLRPGALRSIGLKCLFVDHYSVASCTSVLCRCRQNPIPLLMFNPVNGNLQSH
jgi:hypothetical protein